jgi:CPA2 family monovalent cation:H+ antiporter-2
VPLIAIIAVGLALAFIAGFIATRLRLPPIVGYLLAGVAIGPYTPGFVDDANLAPQLAEIGVILLMFGVGMHFSLRALLEVRRIAVPGALVQIGVAVCLGLGAAHAWGWSFSSGVVFGLALSVASTVVMLRALEQRGTLDSLEGRIAVGWLIVEDLAMVVTLVLMPAVASGDVCVAGIAIGVLIALGKIAALFVIMRFVGIRLFPWLFARVASSESRELTTLFVVAVGLGIAYASALVFGVSFALGAFFAGVVVNESKLTSRLAAEAVPLQNAFSVLFFVSVGMLFDWHVVLEMPIEVLTVVGVIIVGKSLAALLIILAFRYPLRAALTVSASLAQIGEFSFILVALGQSLGVLPDSAQSLVLAGALLSITLNPLVFTTIDPVRRFVASRPRLDALIGRLQSIVHAGDEAPVSLRDHVVLVGFGRVGRSIARQLGEHAIPFVIVEQNREAPRADWSDAPVVVGDASNEEVLMRANVPQARMLVVAVPDVLRAARMLSTARRANPRIECAVRTHTDEELAFIEGKGANLALMAERELADGLARYVLTSYERQQPRS